MGTGSPVDFTSPRGRGVVARAGQARARARRRRASRPTTARAATSPTRSRFADGRTGAQAGVGAGAAVPALDAARARRGAPRRGRAVRPPGLDRPAGGRRHLGRRPAVGLLVAAHARGGHADRRRVGLLQLVARRRRLPRRAARRALPEGAAAALGAVRLLHAADARARALRAGGVDLRRGDARRSTARTCCCTSGSSPTCARRRPRRRAPGCRSSARCCSPTRATRAAGRSPTPTATGRRCGWRRCSRTARASARSTCPRGDWIDFWTGARGRRRRTTVVAPAPLGRIPVWVRRGALIVTYPAAHVARGLGDTPEARAPARGDAVGRAALRPRARPARRRHRGALDARRVVRARGPRGEFGVRG